MHITGGCGLSNFHRTLWDPEKVFFMKQYDDDEDEWTCLSEMDEDVRERDKCNMWLMDGLKPVGSKRVARCFHGFSLTSWDWHIFNTPCTHKHANPNTTNICDLIPLSTELCKGWP